MRLSRTIHAIDLHACGEPGRVITGGVLDVPGRSMFEKMVHLREHGDRLRRLMLREPRGYPAANCNVILPATHPDAVAGYVIMEQVEYPAMSGTNTICVVTALIETGMVPAVEPVTELTLEAPAGLIRVKAEVADGKVTLRINGDLHHIGIGRTLNRTRVILLIHGHDIRIIHATTGEIIRTLTINPEHRYHGTGAPTGGPRRPYGPRKNKQPEP